MNSTVNRLPLPSGVANTARRSLATTLNDYHRQREVLKNKIERAPLSHYHNENMQKLAWFDKLYRAVERYAKENFERLVPLPGKRLPVTKEMIKAQVKQTLEKPLPPYGIVSLPVVFGGANSAELDITAGISLGKRSRPGGELWISKVSIQRRKDAALNLKCSLVLYDRSAVTNNYDSEGEKVQVTLCTSLESVRYNERTGKHTLRAKKSTYVEAFVVMYDMGPGSYYDLPVSLSRQRPASQLRYCIYILKLLRQLGFPRPKGRIWILLESLERREHR
jgi:hypothetical protein